MRGMVSKGGHIRRSMKGTIPVSFSYITRLINKVDEQKFGFSIKKKLSEDDQKLRNKALIVLLYYSARRISEIVGRTLTLDNGKKDVWDGVKVKDFRFEVMGDKDVLIMRVRILKKGKAKAKTIRPDFREVIMDLSWPHMEYLVSWLRVQEAFGPKTKVFSLNRHRAYQILNELDPKVFNHWLRHQRLSHLGEYLTPFKLNERIGFWESLDPAISYVHGRVSDFLEAGDKATA